MKVSQSTPQALSDKQSLKLHEAVEGCFRPVGDGVVGELAGDGQIQSPEN